LKVTYFQNGDGGCDYYRAISPMETAKAYQALNVNKIFSETLVGFYYQNKPKFEEMMKHDIFLLQRMGNAGMPGILRQCGFKGKLVMDFDDNVFDVSPMSNHYVDHGVKDVCFKFPDGTEHWAWRDGVNKFDIKRNQKTLDGIKQNLAAVDMITTTNEILADVFREYNPNVRVLPNCVDLNIWKPSISFKDRGDKIRMLWAGGQSHWEDLITIRDPLREILSKYKNLTFVVMGWCAPGLKEEFGDRIEFHDWVETNSYPYKMQLLDVDFGVIPLRDTRFNVCKSPIKWIEMASLEIPSVSSLVSPYKEMGGLSEQNNGVYIEENDSTAWVQGIAYMIENMEERKRMGREARLVVEKNFDINTQYHQWVNAYQEALCLSPALQH